MSQTTTTKTGRPAAYHFTLSVNPDLNLPLTVGVNDDSFVFDTGWFSVTASFEGIQKLMTALLAKMDEAERGVAV
jgi:hypothetical protein